LIRRASLRVPRAAAKAALPAGGYTGDMDVLKMIGAPDGLPPPAGFGPRINVLRGDDAKQVRF
jgi:hypothetical protein